MDDFESVSGGRDRDFSEFDDDEEAEEREEEELEEGIPVADLPFKPAINIYDLDRLSADEFCPLTLEDDPTCEETRAWGA